MAYLIYWDAACWEAGSTVPDDVQRPVLVPTRAKALQKYRRELDRVKGQVMDEVGMVVSSPGIYEFSTGYTWYALVIEVPDEIKDVEVAIEWIRNLDEESDGATAVQLVISEGHNVHPPDGRDEPMESGAVLEDFLEWLS